MKYTYLALAMFLIPLQFSHGQVDKVAAGLQFSTGTEYNGGETGNPGIVLKTWINLDKRARMAIVPSISGFNRYQLSSNIFTMKNWMAMADLDFQYAFFKTSDMSIVAFAGGNLTYLWSVVESEYSGLEGIPNEASEFAPGGNVGAGLELHIAKQWDGNLSGKYIISSYSQFVISVQAVYYFKSRRRSYYR